MKVKSIGVVVAATLLVVIGVPSLPVSASTAIQPVSSIDVSKLKGMRDISIRVDLSFSPHTIEELESCSANIVKGTLLNDSEQHLDIGKLMADESNPKKYTEFIMDGTTYTSLKIGKVYKGTLKEGNTIKFAEGYWVDNQDHTLIHFGKYMPTDIGREYIFFLSKSFTSSENPKITIYGPSVLEEARYPVISPNKSLRAQSVESMSNEDVNLDEGNIDNYKKLYEQVIQKYMQE